MGNDGGASIWLILILIALLFVVLWGSLFFVIAFGTWFIARNKLPGDDDPRPRSGDWDVPLPPELRPPPDRR